MRIAATVDSIEIRTAGSFTTVATSAGATVLPVFLAADFDEDGGQAVIGAAIVDGQLVGGTTVTYTAAVVDDDGAASLLLTAALASGVPNRTPVYATPIVQSKIAHVIRGDDIGVDSEEADVPSGHLWADSRLEETTTGGQTVTVETALGPGGRLRLVEIPGSPPSTNARYLTPGTLKSAALDLTDLATTAVISTAINMSGVIPANIAAAIAAVGGDVDGGDWATTPGGTGVDGGGW